VRNTEVLHSQGGDEYPTHKKGRGKKKERKANRIGHIVRRNGRRKHVTEGKIEGTGRQGRRRKQLLVGLTEARRYWKLKAKVLYRTLWSSRFGRSYGPVVRETT
jgi:hypothetical protein